LFHQVGDLFELKVKLRCQKVNGEKIVPWNTDIDFDAGGSSRIYYVF
jgi:hypothetical protein